MRVLFSKPSKTTLRISRKGFNDLISMIALLVKFECKANQKLSVAFVTLRKIAKINEEFVGHQGFTDVISFDYRQAGVLDGNDDVIAELIVSHEKALLESERRGNTLFANELTLYIVHGLLHICGFDDLSATDRKKMRRAEKKVMLELEKFFDLSEIFYWG